jgi:hypothetical protein
MPVVKETDPGACGGRLPGAMNMMSLRPGEQGCGPIPGGVDRRLSERRTDPCGNPFPCEAKATTNRVPICYTIPPAGQEPGWPEGCSQPGYVDITVSTDCSGVRGPVLDLDGEEVEGAVEVMCPGACLSGDL